MIFSELYGAYYNTVAKILKLAVQHPVSREERRNIIGEQAFSESIFAIGSSLSDGSWQLLLPDGTTPLAHSPTMPLTILQKRWLKAIALDPRVRLFDFDIPGLEQTEPLFISDNITFFDRYADGDPFEDEKYIEIFHMILSAVKNRQPVEMEVKNRKDGKIRMMGMPEFLEYSEKDDKFRLILSGSRYGKTVNLGRILSCKLLTETETDFQVKPATSANRSVVLELLDERNTLERVLLHFAHFAKEAIRLDDKHYQVKISYRQDDETEMVIRVLSFGPFVRVCEPDNFTKLIRERLEMQKSCGLK